LAQPVTRVGIVGAGLMASQLALLFAQRLEVPVMMTDLDEERVAKGVGYVRAEVDKLLAKGRISQDKANRLKALVTGATSKGGFHFFNPVAVMPLLEIIQGEQTDDVTLATAFATGKSLKKTTILVKDSPSFIVNRLLGRFLGEVARVVDEGTPIEVADRAFAG